MVLFDNNMKRIYTLDIYESLIWDEQYFSTGSIELHLQEKYINAGYIYNTHKKQLGVITGYKIAENKIIYYGKQLKWLLTEEIIFEILTFKNKTSEQIAKEVVAKYFPQLIVEPVKGLGTSILETQVYGSNVLDFTDDLLKQQELGSRIDYNYTTGEMTYVVFEGVDNTTKMPFSETFDNIINPQYAYSSEDYKNFAYVAGETNTDGTRDIVEVDLSDGSKKYKLWVDARDVSSRDITIQEYHDALYQKGIEKLSSLSYEKTVYFAPLIDVIIGEKRLYKDKSLESLQRVTRIITGYENGTIKQSVTLGLQKLTEYEKVKKEVVI